jgi:hypothetical protein
VVGFCENGCEASVLMKTEFLDQLSNYQLFNPARKKISYTYGPYSKCILNGSHMLITHSMTLRNMKMFVARKKNTFFRFKRTL